MELYQKMYLHLFNAVTDALRLLGVGQTQAAAVLLERAQQDCEEMYINVEAPPCKEQKK